MGGVCSGEGVSAPRGCLLRGMSGPGGVSAYGPGGVSQHAMGQTSPMWTDRHL